MKSHIRRHIDTGPRWRETAATQAREYSYIESNIY